MLQKIYLGGRRRGAAEPTDPATPGGDAWARLRSKPGPGIRLSRLVLLAVAAVISVVAAVVAAVAPSVHAVCDYHGTTDGGNGRRSQAHHPAPVGSPNSPSSGPFPASFS